MTSPLYQREGIVHREQRTPWKPGKTVIIPAPEDAPTTIDQKTDVEYTIDFVEYQIMHLMRLR